MISMLHTVEIERAGDLPVTNQLTEMQRWLDREEIRASNLRAVRVLKTHVIYEATFENAADADRFTRAFGRGFEF